jgi:hypothetical protein
VAGLPFDGYIRVSRVGDRSGESYISPTTQERGILEWAQRRGVQVEVCPPEENVSGGTFGLTADALRALPREEKQNVFRAFLDVVFVRPAKGGRGRHAAHVSDRSLILWRGHGPTDLPRPRRYGGPIKSFAWGDEAEPHTWVEAA